jgi:hypothetical protein
MRMSAVRWRNRAVEGMLIVCPMTPRAVIGVRFITALVEDGAPSDVSEEDVDESYILFRGRTFPIREFLYLRCP